MYINQDNFLETSNYIIEKMMNGIDIYLDNEVLEKAKSLKQFMHYNPTNELVINFKQDLAYYFQSFFTKTELFNQFYLPDQQKYYKTQEITKRLPFHLTNIAYPYYLYTVLNLDSDYYGSIANNTYPACFHVFKTENLPPIPQFYQDYLMDFVKKHKEILIAGRRPYLKLEEEIQKYDDGIHNVFHEEFHETPEKSIEECRFEYMSKTIGNIGEIYVFQNICDEPNTSFIAKDLGDGHGYDIHQLKGLKDKLIEVKATGYNREKDYFPITGNEVEVMRETLTNQYADYFVYRIFYSHPNRYRQLILRPIDGNTLLGEQGQIYRLTLNKNGKLTFNQE